MVCQYLLGEVELVPESRFIASDHLKPLVVYLTMAFMVVLGVSISLNESELRSALILMWLVLFPIGVCRVLRRSA